MDDLDRLALVAAREILLAHSDSQPNVDADWQATLESAKHVLTMLEETAGTPLVPKESLSPSPDTTPPRLDEPSFA